MALPKIGITVGDPNGIGLEIILKTLARPEILKYCTPVIYGSAKLVSAYKQLGVAGAVNFKSIFHAEEIGSGQINVLNCWQEVVNISPGEMNADSGKYAYIALDRAVQDIKDGHLDALVTAPIHKQAMETARFTDVGHTEFLTRQLGVENSLMLMVSDDLRIGVVTGHVPVNAVSSLLDKDRIVTRIRILEKTLKVDFGIERPVIAVLGLNPHAGDGGLIGNEDQEVIFPAIMECKKNGLMVTGPHPADGFFGSGAFKKADGILAMYHDQGLVPFKTLSFGKGVNFTAGLPIVRTSPDHGVAYDIAGKGIADPSSFREALYMALDITRNRKRYQEDHANPLNQRDTFRKGEDEKIEE
jgi:4-hydroxythreonine-4-phosphate dehydrogenase